MHKFSNIKVDQLILINPLIRTTTLKLVKKTINKDMLRLGSSKTKE